VWRKKRKAMIGCQAGGPEVSRGWGASGDGDGGGEGKKNCPETFDSAKTAKVKKQAVKNYKGEGLLKLLYMLIA
jgi:uncharacterized spore protein YtfJ